jgi:hypothetical protein
VLQSPLVPFGFLDFLKSFLSVFSLVPFPQHSQRVLLPMLLFSFDN